jgi:hypothetical protein
MHAYVCEYAYIYVYVHRNTGTGRGGERGTITNIQRLLYTARIILSLSLSVTHTHTHTHTTYQGAHIKSAQWARSVEACQTSLESGVEAACLEACPLEATSLEASPPSPPPPRQASCVRMRQDGGVRVRSLDHSAQVTLDPTGR